MNKLVSKIFTSSAYWVVPAGVSVIFISGCGSGAAGKNNTAGSGLFAAGGNAACFSTVPVSVIPGATYLVNVGNSGFASNFGSVANLAPGGDYSMLQHFFDTGFLGGQITPNANDQRRIYASPGAASGSEGGGASIGAGGAGGTTNNNGTSAAANTGAGGGGGGKSASVNTLGGAGGSGIITLWWVE